MAQVKKPTLTRKTVAARAPVPPKPKEAIKANCTPEQRYRMIQEAAYFHAEKAGFAGDSLEFWCVAEKEIDAKLKGN